MRYSFRMIVAISCLLSLVACGEDTKPEIKELNRDRLPATQQDRNASRQTSADQLTGSVKLRILPDNPKSVDCLRVVVEGQPGRSGVRWQVNGKLLTEQASDQLCGDFFKRDDMVTAEIGTIDAGASMTVTISNTPPRVTDITASPDQVISGQPLTVVPVAEDADGDTVDFSYQWLVNGIAYPLLTEATLPGSSFTKGDTVQVLIVPNDFYDDGPAYESYAMLIPNAAPQITSHPPQGITSLDYRYQVEVNDPDDSTFTYHLAEAPQGMSIDEVGGLIQWSLVDVAPGDYTIAIIVADPEGAEAAQEYKLTLGAPQ